MCGENNIKILITFLLLGFFLGNCTVHIGGSEKPNNITGSISNEQIIQKGIDYILSKRTLTQRSRILLEDLEEWYSTNPHVLHASLIGTSLTVTFIDRSSLILFDPFQKLPAFPERKLSFRHESYNPYGEKTVVLLNAAEDMYGYYQCKRIITLLLRHDYSIEYRANQAVDIPFLRHNLTANIVYMNTHAGYFDIDGDRHADAIVIATGECWTNETEQKYAFEYEHNFIIKGMIGNQAVIAFTPAFIYYYYPEGELKNSLIFMATCYALHDTSMAEPFLAAGASAYMGWSENTVFWTNSRVSVSAFRLLSFGFTVQQVCRCIRSGGFYNWLFHSQLLYAGNGSHRIP
jgi:hypothetical protein